LHKTLRLRLCVSLWIGAAGAHVAAAQTNVLTYHQDVARDGLNSSETILTPANVNATMFGRLFQATLDGKVDAQPLYLAGVAIPGQGTHNVLIAVTENDSVYALDADTGAVLWHKRTLEFFETPSDDRNCNQIIPEIGITATPVISTQTSPATIYLVSMSRNFLTGQYFQRLHALAITTGDEQFGGPVDIQAIYPGTGDNTYDGYVIFYPAQYKARAALLLDESTVYITWSSHCDTRPYTGWLMGYNATTLKLTQLLNITPNGSQGALWMSGSGIAEDSSGNLYAMAGNGTFDNTLNALGFPENGDFGNAFLKLSTANNFLSVADYFTMDNTDTESADDLDLGSGGAVVLPDVVDNSGTTWHLVIGGGKDSNIYLANRDNMGKFSSQNDNALYQQLSGALSGPVFSTPAYFNGQIYFGAALDAIRAFQFTNAHLTTASASQTAITFPFPGATPAISSNGTTNGILWAVENASPIAVLHAYSATDLATELYNSSQAANSRDQLGRSGNIFMAPIVANGKVYVGTPTGVTGYGLLAQ
jgi:outer membrane protein assembly factor BamB